MSPVPPGLSLPVRLRYEGRGAVLAGANGNEVYFQDRAAAMTIYALLSELHDYRNKTCELDHCDDGNCHRRGECPPPEPY